MSAENLVDLGDRCRQVLRHESMDRAVAEGHVVDVEAAHPADDDDGEDAADKRGGADRSLGRDDVGAVHAAKAGTASERTASGLSRAAIASTTNTSKIVEILVASPMNFQPNGPTARSCKAATLPMRANKDDLTSAITTSPATM